MPRGDQLIRQWNLIRLLTGRLGRTLSQLGSELGVTKRTVQRDLEVLTTAGFPVTCEVRNGTVFWHFMEGFHAETPIALNLTEQMALYFSKGLFKPLRGTPIYESLESTIQKIGSQLPAQSFKFLRGLEQGISVSSFGLKDYSHSKEVIDTLTKAVFNKFTTRIHHHTPQHEKAIERLVDPYKLWYVNNGLYLVGHDHLKKDIRVFAVERISSVKLTNQRFEVPAEFNFDEFKKTAFNMIWGEPKEVRIRFSPSQAPYIKERTWHPSQTVEDVPDGGVILTLRVADLWEVKRWLIGFGSEAQVLQPDELRADIFREINSFRQLQGINSAPTGPLQAPSTGRTPVISEITSAVMIETILECGAEGGSLAILGFKVSGRRWRFFRELNEGALLDMLSDKDQKRLEASTQSQVVSSWEEVLQLIDKYPWHTLVPLKCHPEFKERILAAVESRGGPAERDRWMRDLVSD